MRYLYFFNPKLPIYLVYMFQQVEYNPHKFLKWVTRVPNIGRIMHRQKLVWTLKARFLVLCISLVWAFYIALIGFYIFWAPLAAVAVALFAPLSLVLFSYLMVLFAWLYIEEPRRSSLLKRATKQFKEHPGIKIAVAGSYGKTSMKELIHTVLAEGKNVAATPGNKNVPVSHAAWVKKLTGQEEVLLIEYGEGAPGDIKKLAKLTHPDYGVITGLAPNHLDEYEDLNAVAKDLLSLEKYVDNSRLYLNGDSAALMAHKTSGHKVYDHTGALGWTVHNVVIDYSGTSFVVKKGKKKISVKSGLLGAHHIGPLTFVAALADKLGLSVAQIEAGLARTRPYEHRMQPRRQHGAWIIDDTYNGSLEGFRAGLALLSHLPAKRKIYVTPGLVDQGIETERVHLEIGGLIAAAKPDRVVLMKNSTTEDIVKGLQEAGYKGDLQIEADPLLYYTNLEHIIAGGDLIVMQNDWTDNYA